MKNKETLYLKALKNSTIGDFSKAQEQVEQILEKDPNYGKAHYLLGYILFEYVNDLNNAKNHAKKAIKFDQCNPLGYYLYCDILIAEQNLEEMKSMTRGIVNLKIIDKAFIYHKLAYIYETRRQYIDAIDALHKSKDHGKTSSWRNFVDNEILRVRRKIKSG